MRKTTILAIIVTLLGTSMIGCSNSSVEVLENNTQNRLEKPITDIKYNMKNEGYMNFCAPFLEYIILGYYKGNIYLSKYYNSQYEIYQRGKLNEDISILNVDGTLRNSNKKIDSKYQNLERDAKNNLSYLFSKSGFLDWRTGKETEVIDNNIRSKISIKGSINILGQSNENLKFIKGSDKYVIYSINNSNNEEIVIADIDSNEYYFTGLLEFDGVDSVFTDYEARKSLAYNIFYDKETDKFYSVNFNGVVTSLIKRNGKLICDTYDKLELDKNLEIVGIEYINDNIYFKCNRNNSRITNEVFKYSPKDKKFENVFKDTLDTRLRSENFSNGYFVISKKNEEDKVNYKYKFYIGTFIGNEMKIIKDIHEETNINYTGMNIYANTDENTFVIDTTVDNGISHRYQVFELNQKTNN